MLEITRVIRGSSYDFSALESRSATRGNWLPSRPVHFIGFRIARSVGDGAQIPPQVASDRELAEWVLNHGGTVARFGSVTATTALLSIDDLPSEPFLISSIDFHNLDLSASEFAEEFARLITNVGPLEEVQLAHCQLSPELMQALSRSQGIHSLILSLSRGIGHEGFAALQRIHGLRHIDVRSTDADDADYESLALITTLEQLQCSLRDGGECLRHYVSHQTLNHVFIEGALDFHGLEYLGQNSNITYLGLFNPSGDRERFFETLGSLQHLESLRLTIDGLTSNEFASICHITGLTAIHFSYGPIVEVDDWSPLANLTEIEILNVGETGFGDADLMNLAGHRHLHTLNLNAAAVTDAGLVHLANIPNLDNLNLTKTAVTSAGIAHLTQLPNLRYLHLIATAVDDDAIPHLLQMKSLVQIFLTGSAITAEGVERLREGLPGCEVNWDADAVTSIDNASDRQLAEWVLGKGGWVLTNAGTGDVTIRTVEELPGEETPIHVDHVYFDGVESIGDEDIQMLRTLCPRDSLYGLMLRGTGITDAALDALAGMEIELFTLGNTNVTDKSAAKLSTIGGLRALDLSDTALTDAACLALSQLDSLTFISLSRTQVTDSGAAQLAALPNLGELHVFENPGIGNETLRWAAEHSTLHSLFIGHTQVTDEGLEHLLSSGITRVEVLDCPGITDRGIEVLSRVETLDSLNLSSLPITDDGIAHLVRLPNIVHLDVHSTPLTDNCLPTLESFKNLTLLRIHDTQLSPEGAQRLHEALPNCQIVWDGGTLGPGAENHALEFDGIDDYVKIRTLEYDGSHPLTIEAWAEPQWTEGHGTLIYTSAMHISLLSVDETRDGLIWQVYHSLPNATGGARRFPPGSVVSQCNGMRVHVAAVYDGTRVRLFLDGVIASEAQGDPFSIISREYMFSQLGMTFEGPSSCFQGSLDEVRISNIARYTEDFTPEERFEPDEHTLALYHFDEGEGETLFDSSGNGHHGEIHGATWVPVNGATDRELAEWVLGKGGGVRIYVDDVHMLVTTIDELPDSHRSFIVDIVDLNGLNRINADDLQTLRSLCVRDTLFALRLDGSGITDAALDALAGMEIDSLRLDNTEITDAAVDKLAKIEGLTNLELADTAISDVGCPGLAGLNGLHFLGLSRTQITDAGAAHLAALPELWDLQIAGNPRIGDATLRWAGAHPSLQSLLVSGTNITDAGLEHLVDSRLVFLGIDGCREITDRGLETLSQVESLESLGLDSLPLISDAGVAHLVSLPRLATLTLHVTPVTDDCLMHLENITSLSKLLIYQTEVSPEGIQRLHEALPECTIIWDGGTLGPVGEVQPQ